MSGTPDVANLMRCPACGGRVIQEGTGVVSPFFAKRVFGSGPALVNLARCPSCGTVAYDIRLSEAQMASLYRGYRSEEYFAERHGFEPWYSRAVNAALGEADADARAQSLASLLAQHVIDVSEGSILDHGGADGRLIAPLKARVRKTYDISGIVPVHGVSVATDEDLSSERFDLVVVSHVLEHLSAPVEHLAAVIKTACSGGAVYLEVPNEQFALPRVPSGLNRRWLGWAVRYPALTKAIDFVSTACRVKFGFVPPGGAPFLREHLVYYSHAGLTALAGRAGLSVLCCQSTPQGHIGLLGTAP